MKTVAYGGMAYPVETLDTVVIGSGCAGLNAADTLWQLGCRSVAILTEGVKMGTSRNTGSDKQTYYKLSLCSDHSDSVYELAQTLFEGGCVNGDTALAEAAGSVRSFMKLVNLGVPFPTNQYGEYVGYKTDHDPARRATSCGPLTSKIMTEQLEASVREKGIPIFDRMQAVRLVTEDNGICGVVALNLAQLEEKHHGLTLFLCRHVILATGGPAILYGASVYPESQTGMTGMALEAGAPGCNLSEWQYGLASVKFRWNVSGTYQQVLPRYLSVDPQGNEREFLTDYFETPEQALNQVFLKGYQWPFDTKKAEGSSLIDLLVQRELDQGNRVYLDFRKNPAGLEKGFSGLSEEARVYLERSGAIQDTPIGRLAHMNPKAIRLYADHGIDLTGEPLEIAVCVQHHNGGLSVDVNWQTGVEGLYAAGEAAGTFGLSRPGGTALNSTQVGSQRAAEHIVFSSRRALSETAWEALLSAAEDIRKQTETLLDGCGERILSQRGRFQQAMSRFAGHLRNPRQMEELFQEAETLLEDYFEKTAAHTPDEIPMAWKNRDMLVTLASVLSAMLTAAQACGSRGSGLVASPEGKPLRDGRGRELLRVVPMNDDHRAHCLITEGTPPQSRFVPVRPLPRTDDWFETVWAEYNSRREKPENYENNA